MDDRIGSKSLNDVLERAMRPRECDAFRDWTPATDVKVTPRETVVYVDLPGIDEDEVNVDFVGQSLRVSGVRDFDHDIEDVEDFVTLGRPFGRFDCRVAMSADSVFDDITAKYKRGVLKVRVPRAPRGEEHP